MLLPYTGLSINSLTYPNAGSGQIFTVGTRGGTGIPITVDNGSTTIAWLSNAGVFTLGSGTSVYGGLSINTPSIAGGASGSDIICGTRGGSANLFHGDNGSSATFNITSAGAISLCQGITTSGTLTVTTGTVLIPGATGTNTPGTPYKFQSGVGSGNALVPSQIFIAGTPTASGTGAQTPSVAASVWPGGVYVGSGTTTDPALGTGNTGYVEGSVLALYAAQTSVAGSTSGTVTFSEPFQGASYKKVIAYMNGGFSGTATYTLPAGFTTTPLVVNGDTAVTTDGTGTIVLTAGGTLPRTVVLEGY